MKKSFYSILILLIGLNFYSIFASEAKSRLEGDLDQILTSVASSQEEEAIECWIDPYFYTGSRVLFCNHPKNCCYFNDRDAAFAKNFCQFSDDEIGRAHV